MKKYILVIVILVFVVIGVTACGLLKNNKPDFYKLDVKCSCPDGQKSEPIVRVPEIFTVGV